MNVKEQGRIRLPATVQDYTRNKEQYKQQAADDEFYS
jgi:hypothetical protein